MPYITAERRKEFQRGFEALHPRGPGELNYAITKLILNYLPPAPGYNDFNAVMGVLVCVIQELYRRILGPYEDYKKEEHGDVF